MELELGLSKAPVPMWEVTLTVPLDQERDRLETATLLAAAAFAQWLRLPGAVVEQVFADVTSGPLAHMPYVD